MRTMDLSFIGKRFNRVLVMSICQGKTQREYLCKCDCGNYVQFTTYELTSGNAVSCGCYNLEQIIKRSTKHGQNRKGAMTTEYKTWVKMKERCYNPNTKEYPIYGGRGIKVCDRWLGENGFVNFFEDMGKKPSPNHSIDRFPNNDGNYEKMNCRWATGKEQCRNKSVNNIIEINGISKCVTEWAEIYNVPCKTIFNRLYNGWSGIDSVTKPIRKVNQSYRKRALQVG